MKRQGWFALARIGVLGGGVGARAWRNGQQVDVQRAAYDRQEDCEADWGVEDCERADPDAVGFMADGWAADPASGDSSNDRRSRGYWRGPYYSRAGTVYRWDGSEARLRLRPSGLGRIEPARLTRGELSDPGGLYPRNGFAQLHASRGGFGSIGRSLSGGG